MRISDWSSDVCSSDLEAVDRGGEPGEGRAEQHPQRHRQEYPQGQKAVEERKAFALRLRHRSSPSAATRLPASSITCSPSSLAKAPRSEEHTSELQSLMRISYAVFCLKKKKRQNKTDKKQRTLKNRQYNSDQQSILMRQDIKQRKYIARG